MLFSDPFFSPIVSQLTRGTATFLPATDVAVSEGDLVLTMDVPGLAADDLSIELLDGHLLVRGERRRPEFGEGTQWAHAERPFGAFERRIKMPDGVDVERITATIDDGVLSLIVPKPERLKPRRIQVGVGQERRTIEAADA